MIEVKELVKRYGDHVAVDHLSFTLEKGNTYGFLGPNGAGKSTTMNMITGYLSPTEGEVRIHGHSILDEPEIAKGYIGYLPEIPPLYAELTVKEYLTFAARLKRIPAAQQKRAIEEAVRLTNLTDVFHRLIANLSKGYKQRVGLAQAILGFPDVIILDEPTVGLDPNQIIETRELIRKLSEGRIVILSSHILSEIQALCNHILIMFQGKLVANGTQEELERTFGNTAMDLTLKTNDAGIALAQLQSFPEVLEIQQLESDQGEVSVRLRLERDADIREKVFYACTQADVPILMMKTTNFSLENIFRALTQEAGHETAF